MIKLVKLKKTLRFVFLYAKVLLSLKTCKLFSVFNTFFLPLFAEALQGVAEGLLLHAEGLLLEAEVMPLQRVKLFN